MLKSAILSICCLFAASVWGAPAPAPSEADLKVKSLYEAEWSWRAKELGGQDTDDAPKAGFPVSRSLGDPSRRLHS